MHNRGTTVQSREDSYPRNTMSQPEEEEEDFVQETLEAALVAAQAYLLTTRPKHRDPREDMHQAAIQSLRIVEDRIRGKGSEAKSTKCKEGRNKEFKHKLRRSKSSESSEEESVTTQKL
jgi:D-alanyl-D-alanine dipeptidase